jgi:hypothetical protein
MVEDEQRSPLAFAAVIHVNAFARVEAKVDDNFEGRIRAYSS